MPLEPFLDEISRALEKEGPASPRERPVIVMFANHVNVDCQTVNYHGSSENELRDAASPASVE